MTSNIYLIKALRAYREITYGQFDLYWEPTTLGEVKKRMGL